MERWRSLTGKKIIGLLYLQYKYILPLLPETIIALLIGYTIKSLKKKEKKHTAVLLLDSNRSADLELSAFVKHAVNLIFLFCDIPLSLQGNTSFPLIPCLQNKK